MFHSEPAFLYWIQQELFWNIEDYFLRELKYVAGSTTFHLHPVKRVWTAGQHKNTCKGTGCYSGVMCATKQYQWTLFSYSQWIHTVRRLFIWIVHFYFGEYFIWILIIIVNIFKSRPFKCSIYLVNFAL